MCLGSKIHHLNDCNDGLMIWRRCWWSSISNRKTCTTWTRVGLQLARRKQEDVLSMLKFVNNSKQSLDVKSGLLWWSAFVPIQASFLLSSFSKPKISQQNGFLRASMATGDSIATQKDGQAMNTVWISSLDVLNLKRTTKQWGNIVFSYAMDTTATLPLN